MTQPAQPAGIDAGGSDVCASMVSEEAPLAFDGTAAA